MWKCTKVDIGQHVPGTENLQTFSIGLHWAQLKTALKPRKMFVVTSRNHTNTRIRSSVSRIRVMATDVLLQMMPTIENVPATYMRSMVCSRFCIGKSQVCLP